MANTGETIGVDYPTLMPDLTDIADIQQAYTMYHIGIANWNGIDPPAANSIEGHFSSVNERVTELEGRPVAGGQVTSVEPTEVGTPPQPVPEGYIWVDPTDSATSILDFPTVIYSPTDPSASLTMADVGTIWIDENDDAGVLNVNDYQLITKLESDAPENPVTGQMWMDIDNDTLYIYNGTIWKEASSSGNFSNTFLMMGS